MRIFHIIGNRNKVPKIKIWRVENSEGEGPYHNEELDEILVRHCNKKTHPAPIDDKDILRWPTLNEICGFIDRKQLFNWFTINELRALRDEGYHLKRVEVSRITKLSKRQVLAIR